MREISEFRHYVQNELLSRCKRNEKYSLRSFAKQLGVPASSLSLILNGSRTLTPRMRQKIGLALGLSLKDLTKFSDCKAQSDSVVYSQYQQIELRSFEIMSDWYHYAILELIKVRDFQPDKKWIANCLNISIHEVNRAVKNLTDLGLLQISESNVWSDKTENGLATNITAGLTTEAAKEMQRQILDKSKESINSIPLECRDHTSLTVAIHKNDLPKVREKIKKFRRELDKYLSSCESPDEVYQLAISFFPATNLKRNTK